MSTGAEIKARRMALGWSREELGRRAGVHPQTINKIERGKTKHSHFMSKIMQVLGMQDEAAAPSACKRCEELAVRITQWREAYYTEAFPEPQPDEWQRAHKLMIDNGMTLGMFMASNTRRCLASLKFESLDSAGRNVC